MLSVFDSHLHIIDPRFPLVANKGYLPGNFTVLDYHSHLADLKASQSDQNFELVGGAIVSGSFQAYDVAYLKSALEDLGRGFVGVCQLPLDWFDTALMTDREEQLARWNQQGFRAVRLNLFRGDAIEWSEADRFARRIFEMAGWHCELYVDAAQLWDTESESLSVLGRGISNLPAASIDHLGLSVAGLPALIELAGRGVRIKATGFGRLPEEFDITQCLQEVARANPGALLFGTDLPGTRAPRAFQIDDLQLLQDALQPIGGDDLVERALWRNAMAFYQAG